MKARNIAIAEEPMHVRTAIRGVVATITYVTLGLAALTSVTAGQASAAASHEQAVKVAVAPATLHAPTHGAGTNGCTLSPDWIFHSACDTHDVCYDSPSTPNTGNGRLACDDQFLRDMRNICAWTYPTSWRLPLSYVQRDYCNAVAATYYRAVRTFGWPYFKNTWLN